MRVFSGGMALKESNAVYVYWIKKIGSFGRAYFFESYKRYMDIDFSVSVIFSPPVIASVSKATQGSVPRTQACFADARNGGETMTKADFSCVFFIYSTTPQSTIISVSIQSISLVTIEKCES